MDKKHICKYCGKEFETAQKLGGHVSRCELNPKYKSTIAKIAKLLYST
jgi:glutathione synthase/RimK-type ligase-like ATP-grasp enzyme